MRHRDQPLWPMPSTPFTVRKNIMITTFLLIHPFFRICLRLPYEPHYMWYTSSFPPSLTSSIYNHHFLTFLVILFTFLGAMASSMNITHVWYHSPSWSCPPPSSPSFLFRPSLSECAQRTSAGSQPTKRGIQIQIQLRKEVSFSASLNTRLV